MLRITKLMSITDIQAIVVCTVALGACLWIGANARNSGTFCLQPAVSSMNSYPNMVLNENRVGQAAVRHSWRLACHSHPHNRRRLQLLLWPIGCCLLRGLSALFTEEKDR